MRDPLPTCNPQSVCCEVWCRQQRVYYRLIRDPFKVTFFYFSFFVYLSFFIIIIFHLVIVLLVLISYEFRVEKKESKSCPLFKKFVVCIDLHLVCRFLRENFCVTIIVRIGNRNHFNKYAVFMFAEPTDNYWRDSSDVWGPSCWSSRCCSPKPAITLATSEYHRPFVPSLVPNHPRSLRISPIKAELQDMSDIPSKYLI